jgi:hypothetical protein
MLVFLNNGNNVLNVSRISTRVKQLGIKPLRPGKSQMTISRKWVGTICHDLKIKGFLESVIAKPPRFGATSPHYHLPKKDKAKMLKVTRLLLQKCPVTLLESDYGHDVVDQLVVPIAEKVLRKSLTKEEMDEVKAACAGSPSALNRILDPNFEEALNRSASVLEHGAPSVETLLGYLDAAFRLDIADARWVV